MASLSYLIYQEKKQEEAASLSSTKAPKQSNEVDTKKGTNSRDVFTSFRRKSTLVESKLPPKQWVSIGTIPPKPPKLRKMIEESGIWQELDRDGDILSTSEGEGYGTSAIWAMVDRPISKVVHQTLKDVMEEVLTMDDQEPIPCNCPQGPCLYHQQGGEEAWTKGLSDVMSHPHQPSTDSSFVEIPHYCTPQFEPQFLTPAQPLEQQSADEEAVISSSEEQAKSRQAPTQVAGLSEMNRHDFGTFAPPLHEESQPSRSATKGRPPLSGRPSTNPPLSRKEQPSKASTLEEADDIQFSSHIPSTIKKNDSIASYQTMVSEITLPNDTDSIVMHSLRIDPRAPQYQMALEQQRLEKGELTERTRNHSVTDQLEDKPLPPARRATPQRPSPSPPVRKGTPKNDPHEITPNFGFPTAQDDDDDDSISLENVMKKETVAGPWGQHPEQNQPQGPFVSPGRVQRPHFEMPSTPQQDSNPLMYPSNLYAPSEGSLSPASIVGPFVSPGAVPRRNITVPNSPSQDSNPLLFPQGIGYFSPSPQKIPKLPVRLSSISERSSSTKSRLPPILPLNGDSENEDHDQRKHSSEVTEAAKSGPLLSIRVKLSPREIVFQDGGVHTGWYSGPIDRNNRLHGNGVFWFTSRDLYLGEFSEGELHGVGIMSIIMDDGTKEFLRGFFRHNEYVGEEEETSER